MDTATRPTWKAHVATLEDAQAMYADMQPRDRRQYNDDFPATPEGFLACRKHGDSQLAITRDGTMMGMVWLHDVTYAKDGTIEAGWIGVYVLRACRGHAWEVWHTARDLWERMDIHRFYIAHRKGNKAAKGALLQAGWTPAGIFCNVALAQNELRDYETWTWRDHPEDRYAVAREMQRRTAMLCALQMDEEKEKV